MVAAESFWDFSIRTYGDEGVPEACLAMQNTHGADVNVLLFCCWMAATHGEPDTETYSTVMAFTNSWAGHVVQPLRAARTWMKKTGHADDLRPGAQYHELRERIKATELEAEQLQQTTMQSMVETLPMVSSDSNQQVKAAARNLYHYCSADDIGWDKEVQRRLAVILGAAMLSSSAAAAAKLAALDTSKPASPDLRRADS